MSITTVIAGVFFALGVFCLMQGVCTWFVPIPAKTRSVHSIIIAACFFLMFSAFINFEGWMRLEPEDAFGFVLLTLYPTMIVTLLGAYRYGQATDRNGSKNHTSGWLCFLSNSYHVERYQKQKPFGCLVWLLGMQVFVEGEKSFDITVDNPTLRAGYKAEVKATPDQTPMFFYDTLPGIERMLQNQVEKLAIQGEDKEASRNYNVEIVVTCQYFERIIAPEDAPKVSFS